MPSTTDNEFASLLASYGPGLSLQDMRMKQQGGPTTPGKSLTDLEYSYFASNGGSASSSRSDNEGKYWQGNNSLSDDKNNAGSVLIQVRINLAVNPGPGSAVGWVDGSSFAGTGGTFTGTFNTTGGPSAASPTRYTRTWTVAASSTGVYSGYGRSFPTDIACTAGNTMSFSVWIKPSWANGVTGLRVLFYDSGNALVGSEVMGLASIHAQNVWEKRTLTTVVPANATHVGFRMWSQNFAPQIGDTLDTSSVMAEVATDANGSYFDGSTTDTFETDYAWTGAANASTSTATSKSVPSGGYTNLCPNPVPASINYWQSNDQSKYAHLYANNEISIDRQATATVDTVLSAYVLGFGPPPYNPALPVGVKYQRSVEVWVDAAAVTAPANSGFNAGTNLPANTWTRIVEQFTGNGVATYVLSLGVNIAGATTGIHAKMRKAQLMENPSGLEQPYFDGSTPDTATMDFEWTGAANSSTSTAKRK